LPLPCQHQHVTITTPSFPHRHLITSSFPRDHSHVITTISSHVITPRHHPHDTPPPPHFTTTTATRWFKNLLFENRPCPGGTVQRTAPW
jgi:hypothetical protein